jgi:hypothetical protein
MWQRRFCTGLSAVRVHKQREPMGMLQGLTSPWRSETRFTCRKVGFSTTTYLQMRPLWRAFR